MLWDWGLIVFWLCIFLYEVRTLHGRRIRRLLWSRKSVNMRTFGAILKFFLWVEFHMSFKQFIQLLNNEKWSVENLESLFCQSQIEKSDNVSICHCCSPIIYVIISTLSPSDLTSLDNWVLSFRCWPRDNTINKKLYGNYLTPNSITLKLSGSL